MRHWEHDPIAPSATWEKKHLAIYTQQFQPLKAIADFLFGICFFSTNSIYIQETCDKRSALYFQQSKEHLEVGMKETMAMFYKLRRETQGNLRERAHGCVYVSNWQFTQQSNAQHESLPSPFSHSTQRQWHM